MKTKRKISIALLLVLSLVVLIAGSFAFFSDKKATVQTAKVGTLKLEYESNITYENDLNNINPGDNDKTVSKDSRPSTDHELLIRTKNIGTKSAVVKHIIKVNATKNGNPVRLISDEGRKLLLFTPTEKETLEDIGDSSKQKVNRGMGNEDPISFKFNKDFTSMYYVSSEYPINGTEEIDAQKDEIAKVYDLGPSKFAENEFAGAEIKIEIQTLAMQYRNTGKSEWIKAFKDELTLKQDPIPGKDEKPDEPKEKPEMVDEETAETVDWTYAVGFDNYFRTHINLRVFVDERYNEIPEDGKINVVYTEKDSSGKEIEKTKECNFTKDKNGEIFIEHQIERPVDKSPRIWIMLKNKKGNINKIPVFLILREETIDIWLKYFEIDDDVLKVKSVAGATIKIEIRNKRKLVANGIIESASGKYEDASLVATNNSGAYKLKKGDVIIIKATKGKVRANPLVAFVQ